MSDFIIGFIEDLAERSIYDAEYLMDLFNEMVADGETNFEMFEQITMEQDW